MISYFPVVTGSLVVLGNVSVSGSINTSGSITISGSITSASFASTASFVGNAQTASFVALAQSASNAVSAQTASFANAFTVANTLTAQTLVVQTITSSVDFVTGSTRFGSLSSNTHTFTGSLAITGGLAINAGTTTVGVLSGSSALFNSIVGINGASEAGWALKSNGNLKVENSNGTTVLQLNDTSTGGKAWSLISAGAGNAHSIAAGTFYLRNSSDGSTPFTISSTGATSFASNVSINSASGLAGAQGFLFFNNSPSNASSRNWKISNDQNDWGDFVIQYSSTQTGATSNTAIQITRTGLVGIGTTSPGYTLTVNGSTYSGTSNTMNNSFGATGGQAAQVVSQEFGGTSFAVNLATLLPNYTFSGRALSVVMHVIGVSDSSNGSSTLVNAYRSIGGTWVINTVNTAQNGTTFINSITGSGTTITVNWNTTAFGVAYITVINRG